MKLLFHPAAEDALKDLKDDPARAELFRKIVRTIRTIRDEPGRAEVRREAWQTAGWGQVWAVPVRDADEDWLVVWTPDDPDTVIVLYVGKDVPSAGT